jgi:hypothetical protein
MMQRPSCRIAPRLLMNQSRNPPADSAATKKRRAQARSIGALALESLDPLTRQRGFAGAELVSRWPDIAGEKLARHSRPLALKWPMRPEKADPERMKGGATLEIAVSPAFALDLQYAAPLLTERLNALLGWRCVEKVRLLQQPVALPEPALPAPSPLSTDEKADLEERLRKIDDEELRQALFRLGDGVIRRLKDR